MNLCDAADALLRRHYHDLGEAEGLAPLGERACRLRASGREWVLKHHADWVGGRIAVIAAAHLTAAQAGLGPELRPVQGGELLVSDGGAIYSLQAVLGGERPGPEDAPAVAVALARLHRVFASVPHQGTPHHLAEATKNLLDQARGYGFPVEAGLAADAGRFLDCSLAQLVHGDPHPANMIAQAGEVRFVDFDSAHLGSPAQEAAFAAFRLLGTERGAVASFVRHYAEASPEAGSADELVRMSGSLALHAVLRRLVFILAERDRGETRWMSDLENQRRYAGEAASLAAACLKEG